MVTSNGVSRKAPQPLPLLEAQPCFSDVGGSLLVLAAFSYRSLVDGLVRLVHVLQDAFETSSDPGGGDVVHVL